ncbi:EamA family transporter [Fulvivirgaceae bacterium PWU4]|uniref:EamA family transporter n=1 Tax=Chryseosolibacter histidini TaxID=2782349 RepID=A0AAP2GRD3_9BACT|nr:EamA family transporter [Chryseosolibacter histidini]MBT1699457.1 EamA family transporter [Chryseosolibacter histidini]
MNTRSNYIAYFALAAVCLIWGTTYLALRIAVVGFPPFLFTALRQTTAGIILLSVMFTLGKAAWPTKEHIFRQAIGGFFMLSLGNGLVAWAEMHIPSGVAAIICSLMPVMVIIINLFISADERPTMPIIAGVALGLIGIIMIFGEHIAEFSKTEYLIGIVLTFAAVISWAGGSIWIKKKNTDSNPFVNAGLQMFFGGFWCFPLSLLFDDLSTVTWSAEVAWSMAYLIIFGSIVAYASYSYALRKLPMTIVSLYAYVNPLVAVLLGWLVLDEMLNLKIIVAFLLTVAGIYIVNRGYQLRNEWKAQFTK